MSILKKFILKLFKPIISDLENIHSIIQINQSISRASAGNVRILDSARPLTWEFSGFSQNGEDGIIDYLCSKLTETNKYFIEIGCSNGIENNTAFLAFVKKYSGLWIDGDQEEIKKAQKVLPFYVRISQLFVNQSNLKQLDALALFKNPDVLSLDIDGNDYYILKLLLENGYKPKIIIVEYNSAYGPEKSMTIKYDENFNMYKSKFPFLYYGVSIRGWQNLLNNFNYKFITVESNGVNAFFVDASCYDEDFLSKIEGVNFNENIHQRNYFRKPWQSQFEIMEKEEFEII